MIDRLFEDARRYGEPEYSDASEKVTELEDILKACLEADNRKLLFQLTDACARRENIYGKAAFRQGFCAAVELMLDVLTEKNSC